MSGQYKIAETTDKAVTFVRNENYWGMKPRANKVVLELTLDENDHMNALANNQIDIAMYLSENWI